MQEVAKSIGWSVHKVLYNMNKYCIKRRTISQAIYLKHNPNGDPFKVKTIKSVSDAKLLGIGIGLYWGEGTKMNKHSVRLGNTDPALIRTFILFLTNLFGVSKNRLRFGLQIFTDIDKHKALDYWINELGVRASQFYKITVTISGSIGTYRNKSLYGVVTVYFNNTKLRDVLVGMLPR